MPSLSVPQTRVLVFDVECRPTAWFGGDYVGKSMTAAAWRWLDDPQGRVDSVVLTREMYDVEPIVGAIWQQIRDADVVVGHYIRGFDLPLVNADLERLGYPALDEVLTVDTKGDRLTTLGLSQSLENLVARYELEHDKIPMHEPYWEEHNLWQTPRSVDWVRTRVEGDVRSTAELYRVLVDEGRLGGPKLWDPRKAKLPRYVG